MAQRHAMRASLLSRSPTRLRKRPPSVVIACDKLTHVEMGDADEILDLYPLIRLVVAVVNTVAWNQRLA